MEQNIKFIIVAVLLINATQFQAQSGNFSEDRFPFEYNERSKTPKVSLAWEKTFSNLKGKLLDKDNRIILHSYASATGKKAYNYKLSKDRGKAVSNFLIGKGVDKSRINIEPHGEPNVENYGEDDYAGDRDVLPEFRKVPPEEYEDPIDKYRNKETLEQDIKDGDKIFYDLVGPDIENVKKKYQMVRKVFLDNPSADPEELLKQVKGILEEMEEIKSPKDLAKFIAKIGLDSFIDLFTSLGAKEVNISRQIKYVVIIEAITSECFPKYIAETKGYGFDEKMLFYSVKIKLSQLSDRDKYKLRARFIAGKSFEMYSMPSSWRYEHKMKSISMFKRSLDNWFKHSENRYRD